MIAVIVNIIFGLILLFFYILYKIVSHAKEQHDLKQAGDLDEFLEQIEKEKKEKQKDSLSDLNSYSTYDILSGKYFIDLNERSENKSK